VRPGERVLGLFAKWPAPGSVKTRLAAAGGPAWGARVARAFLLDSLDRLAAVDARRVLAFAPAESEADFAALTSRFTLTPQGEGDLGQRLAGFVGGQLDAGARAVVVVGTDSPTLPMAYVEQAFAELERADAVLGPATDGGYYLVGCGPHRPPLFEGIAWSTGRVLVDTVAALSDPGWKLALLPPWYDVDTPDDWVMLAGHLAALRRAGIDPGVPHTEALLREAADGTDQRTAG
jgi:rSAM/selenodomain-associated transferase 1